MRIPRPRVLIVVGLCAVALVSLALFAEGPARRLAPDEQTPERIVLHKHPKFGGQELATLTNHEAVFVVMTALPSHYSDPYCACFGYYQLDFYAPTGIFRTVSYKPGFMDGYVRDSTHQTGQSSVPRRFKRIIGSLIDEHESR